MNTKIDIKISIKIYLLYKILDQSGFFFLLNVNFISTIIEY